MPGLRVRIRVPYLLSQRERRKEREREPGKIHRGSLPGDPDMPRVRIAVRCGLEDLVPRRGEPRCQGDGCPALTRLFLSGGGRGDWKDTNSRAGKTMDSPPGAPCESLEAAMAAASARSGADSRQQYSMLIHGMRIRRTLFSFCSFIPCMPGLIWTAAGTGPLCCRAFRSRSCPYRPGCG